MTPQAEVDMIAEFWTESVQRRREHRFRQTGALKAVPAHCAPSILWNANAVAVSQWPSSVLLDNWQAGVTIPSEWVEAWLCLLPKKAAHPKSPGELRPIALLDPLRKAVLMAIKLRVHPLVSASVVHFPHFAFMAQRSTQHALYRVLQHSRNGRDLAQRQRLTLIDRFHGASQATCQGALQISLDYSKACDSMDRQFIKPSLL